MPPSSRVTPISLLFFAAAAFLPGAVAQDQTFTLGAASAGSQQGELQINITESLKGGVLKIPPAASVEEKSLWRVTVYERTAGHLKLADPVAVNRVTASTNYSRTGEIVLATSAPYALDPYTNRSLVIEINFLEGDDASTVWLSSKRAKPAGEEEESTASAKAAGSAEGQSSSGKGTGCGAATAQPTGISYFHYCLSGIWVPQEGSHPLYSTNSNFAAARKLWSGSFGLRGQEAADSSVVIDPNAFSSALFYQSVLTNSTPVPRVMGVYLNWNIAETEFDRKKKNTNLGTNLNFITAPELVFPISFGHIAGAELDAGIEAGNNFKNNMDRNGFGTIFRGLLGAQVEKIYNPGEQLKALNQIKISSQYQVRLLAENEVITRAVHGVLVPYVGHQGRNWVSTEIDFMFTKNFGFTLKHDYGALPPGFVFVENRGTVGFTVQSAQH